MAKKEKEVYVELKGILGNAEDYHVYHMTRRDYVIARLLGFLLGAVVVYAFFRSLLFTLAAGVIAAFKAPEYYNTYKKKARLKQLREQFKELLESLASSYSAGKNTVDAFTDAREDLISIYGQEGDMVKELKIICSGLHNNINIEDLLLDLGKRSGLEDVISFAHVFEVCNRQGSDLRRVVSETREILNDKIEVEMEIETMLSGNKNELYIMMVMPVVVVLSLSAMGTMSIVSNSPVNVLVKLVCIGIFGGAYLMGRKIIDIRI